MLGDVRGLAAPAGSAASRRPGASPGGALSQTVPPGASRGEGVAGAISSFLFALAVTSAVSDATKTCRAAFIVSAGDSDNWLAAFVKAQSRESPSSLSPSASQRSDTV